MAQRLPTPGQDDGSWGYILNGFLEVAHNADGTLTTSAVSNALPSPIPTTNLGSGTASSSNFLRGDGTWAVPASANNATTSAPGLVQLAGDLAGTATSPTVPGLTAKAPLASPTFTGTVTVPTPVNATDATTKTYVDTQVSSGTADATTSTKGKVQLAGDLAGTAAAPSVAKINGITLPGTAPTTGNVLTATSTTATAWTTPAAGVMLDTTSTDIVAGTVTGSGVAGSVGKAADAGHQHPLQAHDHTTTNKGGQVPVAGLSATGTASSTTYLRGDGSWSTPAGASNATTSAPGVVQLAGDLGGTATAPTVAKVNGIAITGTPSANQVLTASGTTAASWSTPAAGFADPTTTKGDLIIHGTSSTTRQAIGADGQVLTADSTQTTGAKWATPSTTDATKLAIANNLSDLASATTARTNLGLGTAATISSTAGGDLSGTLPSPTVAKINGITLPGSAPSAGNVLTATSSTATSWTTPAAGVTLDSTAADIQPDTITGTAAAGSTGRAADAGHQHPLVAHDHTTANKGGQIPVGGLSATGTASATTYLRGDGSWTAPSSIDSTKLAIANNLSDLSSASTAITNLGLAAGATMSTTAGGDLSGTLPSPTVAKVNGVAVTGTPSNGYVITATGTSTATWQAVSAGSGAQALTTTAVKTSAYTAAAGDLIPADAGSAPFIITLPITPADKTRIAIKKIDSSANVITITTSGSDVFNKTGGGTSLLLSVQNQAVNLQYASSTGVWYVVGDDLPLSQLDNRYGDAINVKSYGAKLDGQTVAGAVSSSSSATVTAGSASFTSADVGKYAVIWNTGNSVGGSVRTIIAVGSATSITLSGNAGVTSSGASSFITYGSDDSASINAALAAAAAMTASQASNAQSGWVDVVIPGGGTQSSCVIANQIVVPAGVQINTISTIYNLLASRNAYCIKVSTLARFKLINLKACYGTGVLMGTTGNYATITGDDIRVGNAGGSSVTPTTLAVTGSTSGGTLSAATRRYVVTGIDSAGGESVVSNEVTVTNTGTASSNSLTWTGDASFVSYRVYSTVGIARSERAYQTTSSTSFTDTGAATSSAFPVPPGTAINLQGYHYEIGRVLVGGAAMGICQNSTDTSIGSVDLIGCATAWRAQGTNTSCPTVIIDTCGSTDNSTGYVSEGGLVLDSGAAHFTLKVKAFCSYATTLSPIVSIGPYTANSCGDLDIEINANNQGGTVLALSNLHASNFRIIADNTSYNGSPSDPIVNGVAYGSNIRSDVHITAVLDPTVTTPYTGTISGYLEYLQNGSWVTSGTSAAPNEYVPGDDALLAWSQPPDLILGSFTPTSGVMYLVRLPIRQSISITNVLVYFNSGGSNLVSGQNFAGIYNASGTLVASSVDQTSSWNTASTVTKTAALASGPYTLAAGTYYVGILTNWATTGPTIGRSGSVGINTGRGVAPFRFMSYGTGQTTLPSTITLSSGGSVSNATWTALS